MVDIPNQMFTSKVTFEYKINFTVLLSIDYFLLHHPPNISTFDSPSTHDAVVV